MGKFKHRAFITGCFCCQEGRHTLCKLDNGPLLCLPCKSKLDKNGWAFVHNGGKIVRIKETGKIGYVPPVEKKEDTILEEEVK